MMLGYQITYDDRIEGPRIVLAFANSERVALAKGAREFDTDSGDDDLSIARAPWADEYAPGPTPAQVLIDQGWTLQCHHCDQTFDEYVIDGEGDEHVVTPLGNDFRCWCSPACLRDSIQDKVNTVFAEERWLAYVRTWVLLKLPTVEIVADAHRYCTPDGVPRCMVANFRFPGGRIGTAQARIDGPNEEPHVLVCSGDREAFEAYRDGLQKTVGDA